MGRIRNKHIKRSGEKLISKHKFTNKFEENKKLVTKNADIQTKKLRNQIAGYITKKVKTTKELKL